MPTLHVTDGRGGRLLLPCSAGCSFEDMMDSLRGIGLDEGGGRAPEPDPAEAARRQTRDRRGRERGIRRAQRVRAGAAPIPGRPGER